MLLQYAIFNEYLNALLIYLKEHINKLPLLLL